MRSAARLEGILEEFFKIATPWFPRRRPLVRRSVVAGESKQPRPFPLVAACGIGNVTAVTRVSRMHLGDPILEGFFDSCQFPVRMTK